MRLLCYPVALATAMVTSGCSLLLQLDGEQCRTDSDCVQSGLGAACSQGVCGSSPGKVTSASCGSVPTCAKTETCFKEQCAPSTLVQPFACERPHGDPSAAVSLTLHITDYLSNKPVDGLVVRACPVADVLCQAPVATVEGNDGSADVVLHLPYGFAGFLDLTAKDTIETLFYFGKPLVGTVDKAMTLAGSSAIDGLAALALQANVTIDRSAGITFAQAFDCEGKAAGGIRFEASEAANSFFVVNGLPSLDAQLTVRDEAANAAGGGFFNLQPGFAVFTARVGTNGPKLGEYNAQVRAAGVTSLEFYP
jgi:hypothetical protein